MLRALNDVSDGANVVDVNSMDPRDSEQNELNPGERHWSPRFEVASTLSGMEAAPRESSTGGSADAAGSSSDDLGEHVRDRESTVGSWTNNVTGTPKSPGGIKGLGTKARALFKKKGATAVIVALLGGGASIPFLGAASLPFSILGNMDAKSMMHGLEQYSEDYMGFSIFNTSKGSVSSTANKIKGLRASEIEQLKAQGVEFEGAKPNKLTGKTTFTAVKFNGETIHAGKEFNTAMRSNVAFRKAMVFNRGSYWKSAKSTFASSVKKLFKIDTNPDLSGKDEAEKNKRMMAEASEGKDSHPQAVNDENKSTTDKNGNTVPDPEAAAKDEARKTAGDLAGNADKEAASIADGKVPTTVAEDVNMGNVGGAFQREGVDLAGDATKGLGGKIWSYVNPLGVVDTACTIYSVAQTANTLARTVALVNVVRFAMTIRATIERAKAGDDNGKDTAYLMSLIQLKDPTTGQSFDESSYAAFLFSGQLSSEPSTVSAFGGQAMIALYMTMHAVHSLFGQIAHWGSFGLVDANAASGRKFLKTGCKIAQNVGVQIGAAAVGLVLSFFTGGGATAAEVGAQEAVKVGFKVAVKEMIKSVQEDGIKAFVKDVLKQQVDKLAQKAGEDSIKKYLAKYMARSSWKAFKEQFTSLAKDPFQLLGLLAAGAGAFGMGYIIDVLSGGNIAGMLDNGLAAFDGLGTGWNQYESVNGIASGGTMATYAQATAYQQTQQQYQDQYVADQRNDAKGSPFDLTTPYSALGAAMFGMQKTIGVSASLSLPSTLAAVASLPFKLPTLFAAHADDTPPTPQQIGDQLNNPFFKESQIATTTTGSPQVIFAKHYSFQDILDQLVDSPTPQVTYGGDDPTTGEPMLSIIPGSKLDQYAQACHNPDKTEADPEFQDDNGDNAYDTSMCVPGGSNYNSATYPLYDDAIRFIGQVSPDATSASASSTSGPTAAATTGLPANAEASGAGWALKDHTDYSNIACAPGTTDLGTNLDDGTYTRNGYVDHGSGTTVRVCGVKGGKVASVISQNVLNLLAAAQKDGLNITISSGLRTYQEQVDLFNSNCSAQISQNAGRCSPATAVPGQSNHEKGTAVDWGLNGQTFCFPSATCAPGANKGYDWFSKNAATYEFHKLSSEAWHWSTNGG